jgi:hypothetical protein
VHLPVVGYSEVQAASPALRADVGNATVGITRVDEDLVLVDQLRVQGQQVRGGLVVLHTGGAGSDVQGGHDCGVGQPGVHGGLRAAGVVLQGLRVAGAHLEGVRGLHGDALRGEDLAHGGQSGLAGALGRAAAVVAAALVIDVVHCARERRAWGGM